VDKGGYVVVLGRINHCKGQDVAVRLAHRAGVDLVLPGPVGAVVVCGLRRVCPGRMRALLARRGRFDASGMEGGG
jgi:hypothetical protein